MLVPNPLLPNNKAPALMPTVFAEDTYVRPLNRPLSGSTDRPSSSTASRPITPGSGTPNLKGCLKTHSRTHSAATAKRARFSDQLAMDKNGAAREPKTITHSSSTVAQGLVKPILPVHHDDAAPPSSMFSMSSSNPSFTEYKAKHINHYVPLSQVDHPHESIQEHVKYRLDNRVMSLQEAFEHLDVHNSGFITQEELLNVPSFLFIEFLSLIAYRSVGLLVLGSAHYCQRLHGLA